MKYLFLSLLFLVSCSTHSEEKIEKLDNPLLVKILAFGELTDLNQLQKDVDKELWVKIYKVPSTKKNDCFPESHGICEYEYYLVTSQFDENPTINAYFLGIFGEFTDYKWESATSTDKAIININVSNYSNAALKYNKTLKKMERKYQLVALPNKIVFGEK